jgi:hypothetical protein
MPYLTRELLHNKQQKEKISRDAKASRGVLEEAERHQDLRQTAGKQTAGEIFAQALIGRGSFHCCGAIAHQYCQQLLSALQATRYARLKQGLLAKLIQPQINETTTSRRE